MNIKKIAATIMAAAMLVTAAPMTGVLPDLMSVTVSAVETLGDYEYYVNEDGETVTINQYIGTDTEVVIPAALGGKTVTVIGSSAFSRRTSLTSVGIPDSVTTIGDWAFAECTSLTSVEIPDSVTRIDSYAFSECTSLTSVTIPDSVAYISTYAFNRCSSLKEITVGEDNACFSSIDGVLFNKDKTIIVCFPAGKQDTSYTIPDSVAAIADMAFSHCTSLKEIIVGEDNAYFSSIDGVLFNKDKTIIVCFPAGKQDTSYTIPDSVTRIDSYAFYKCTSLASVEIPDSVTTIGDSAFSYCTSLTSVEIPDSVTTLGPSAFNECTSLASVKISDSVTTIDYRAFCECTSLASVEIPDSVTTIDDLAFANCTSLASVEIPDSVTTIGMDAFAYCTSLTSVEIPDSVTTIGGGAFACCTSLTSVEIPDSVTTIGDSAFFYCTALTSVKISDSVTTIDYYAFYECTSLTTVNYGGTKAEWEAIEIGVCNEALTNAQIICTDGIINEREPDPEVTTEPDSEVSTVPDPEVTTEPDPEETEPERTQPEETEPDPSDKKYEISTDVEIPPEAADIPEDDMVKSITVNAFKMKNKGEIDLSEIKIKAREIYDEESLKRAEEALGEVLDGNTHYNLLDLTLLYKGEDFSNGYEGLIEVKFKIPDGHKNKTFSCYRMTEVDGKMVKELIPGTQTEDYYIIYLEHFSLYALVADGNNDDSSQTSNLNTGVTSVAAVFGAAAFASAAVLIVCKKKRK